MSTDYTPIGPVPSGIANGTVDATSRQLARDMRGKAYGKDVRETMARMTEWHSIRSSASEVLAAQSAASAKKTMQSVDGMVIDLTQKDFDSAPEIIAARRGKPSLGAKIDEIDAEAAHNNEALNKRVDNLVIPISAENANIEVTDSRVSVVKSKTYPSLRKRLDETETDITILENAVTRGKIIEHKLDVIARRKEYEKGKSPTASGESLGKHLNEVAFAGAGSATNFLFDVEGVGSIKYPVFKTSTKSGCLMLDKNNVVIGVYANEQLETGNYAKVDTPPNAKYFLLAISTSLSSLEWRIELETKNRIATDEVLNKMDKKMNKSEVLSNYGKYEEDTYLSIGNAMGGHINDVRRIDSNAAYLIKIDISEYTSISYPVFRTSSGYGTVITDKEGIVIWEHGETEEETGTLKTIIVPSGAKHIYIGISGSLSNLAWSIVFSHEVKKDTITEVVADIEEIKGTLKSGSITPPSFENNKNKNLSLAALRTDILDEKIPFHSGYLFHGLSKNDGELWYGNDFDNLSKIGTANFDLRLHVLAMSPRDGRVIGTRIGTKGSMYVWDGERTFELFSDPSGTRPKGWLYNAGVEFVNDENGIEYCLFAEYSSYFAGATGGFKVWRGKYPYTSESDWEIVFYQDYVHDEDSHDGISHFHQIRRDPWTDILYLTSGDYTTELKWWYSLDFGKTWELLADSVTSGWEAHTMRCINFIFTKDDIYWAVDHGVNHSLNSIKRNTTTGLIDMSTRSKLTDLPYAQATNSLCYVDSPNGLFMFDRVDIGTQFESHYKNGVDVQFWSFDDEQLYTILNVKTIGEIWGGHRGKCYTNYTNGYEPRPAMGFSFDTPCIFDVVHPRPSEIGTVSYELKSGVVRFVTF